jgi:hypothetical protein
MSPQEASSRRNQEMADFDRSLNGEVAADMARGFRSAVGGIQSTFAAAKVFGNVSVTQAGSAPQNNLLDFSGRPAPGDISAMIAQDTLNGRFYGSPTLSAHERREVAALRAAQQGPMLVPHNPEAESYQRLRGQNLIKNALLLGTPAGFPGAVSSLAGQDEYEVEAAHEVGGAIFGLQAAIAGVPTRGPISVGPRSPIETFSSRAASSEANRLTPRVDVTDEFILKSNKNGSSTLRYGDPEGIHGLILNVDKNGILGFEIRAPQGGSSFSRASGTDMFLSAMQRLEQHNIQVSAIRGTWIAGTDSVNAAQYQSNISLGMSPQQAAANTWTGRIAASQGYTNVGTPTSNFGTTTVHFRK